jgi:hypothetical protein
VLPWPRRVTLTLAVPAGALAAAGTARLLIGEPAGLQVLPATVLGLALGAVVAGLSRLAGRLPTTSSRQAAISVGAAVVSTGGAVTYLAARLFS